MRAKAAPRPPDMTALVDSLLAGVGKASGAGSGSGGADPSARARGAARCDPDPLPDAIAAAAIRLGAAPEDIPRWRATIQAALDRAEADFAVSRAMTARSPLRRRLRRLGRLADAAARRKAGAHAKLCDHVGDGVELDRDLDEAMGLDADDPVSMVARAFADRASPYSAGVLAGAVERAVSFATPRSRARRGRKLFAVVGLALAYVELTGRRPTYSTDADGGRVSPFVSFCISVDSDFGIDHDGRGLDRAARDAIRIAGPEIETSLVLRELG